MAEGKTLRKSKAVWWVLTQKDEVLLPHYKGPDKKKARETAARYLAEGGEDVIVARVSSLAVLSDKHLVQHLPKTAF